MTDQVGVKANVKAQSLSVGFGVTTVFCPVLCCAWGTHTWACPAYVCLHAASHVPLHPSSTRNSETTMKINLF